MKCLGFKCFQKEKMVIELGFKVIQIKRNLLFEFMVRVIGRIESLARITIRIKLLAVIR